MNVPVAGAGIGAVAVERRAVAPRVRAQRFLAGVAHHAALIAASTMFTVPMVFVVVTALMGDDQAVTGALWPEPVQWSNFAEVFDRVPVGRYLWNSLRIGVLSTVGVVVSSLPVAYALSHLRWRGRDAVFLLVLVTYMLPPQVTIVPLYRFFADLGWVGTINPLVVPSFFGNAFTIFLLRQFMVTIPRELTDAARMEGAGEWRVLVRVVVPLAKPAIAAAALFHFLFMWNDLFHPLLYLAEERDLWTLPLALSAFRGLHAIEWNTTMAASVLFMVPVIVVFLVAQRALVRGVALTGAPR